MKPIKVVLTALLLIVGIAFLLPRQAYAQTDNLVLGYAPNAVYPVLTPGQTYTDKTTFWNTGAITTQYDVIIRGIRNANEQAGTAVQLSEEEDLRDQFSASSWVKIDRTTFTLTPNSQVEINYTITVPNDALSGGYYASIMAVARDNELSLENQIASQSKLSAGTVVVLTIKGGDPIVENLKFIHFDTNQFIYFQSPTRFRTRLDNTGNVNLFPTGKIVVKNIFGERVAEFNFAEEKMTLLRGKESVFIKDWLDSFLLTSDRKLLIGPMTADLVLIYSTQNPGFSQIQATTTFWLIPWPLLVIVAIIAIYLLFRRSKKRRRSRSK